MYTHRLSLSYIVLLLFCSLIVSTRASMVNAAGQNAGEGALELVLNNMDRYRYVVFVDGKEAGSAEGYAGIQPKSWERSVKKGAVTVLVEHLSPGTHTVRIEVAPDPDTANAQSREEFLTAYRPLAFEVNIDGKTRHEINAQTAFENCVEASQSLIYDQKNQDWQAFTYDIAGQHIEVKIQQIRKKDKLGRAAQRLNAKGQYDRAYKYVYYLNVGATVDGQIVHTEKFIPYGGRVEYQYWDFVRSKWIDDAFNDNTMKDDERIAYFKTVSLKGQCELRIMGHGDTVSYTILNMNKRDQTPPQ